jgi:hypothetical protein
MARRAARKSDAGASEKLADRSMRDIGVTGEPRGARARFVTQKHAMRRLHDHHLAFALDGEKQRGRWRTLGGKR